MAQEQGMATGRRDFLKRAAVGAAALAASVSGAAGETPPSGMGQPEAHAVPVQGRERMGAKNRAVRVATVTQDGLRGLPREQLVSETLERLEAAACTQPDIVCLPEMLAGDEPEPVPGPTTERLSQWAKERCSYVICPVAAAVGGGRRNSALVIDRTGGIIGRYDKMHPTESELESGTVPGMEAPVFRTDFGTIGIQICFDVNWHESWRDLKNKGAEIVFWPSAYPAPRMLSALAWMNEYYVVSSTMTRESRIYDITGEVIAASGKYQPWAQATLHLSKRLFETDYNADKARRLQMKYGRRLLVQWYHDESWFTLASLDPDLSVEKLIEESGLLPLRDYQMRAERAVQRARRLQ